MASILVLPNGRKLDVDRFFTDGGRLPVMAMLGGQKTVLERGSAPKITIYQKGKAFFTLDEKLATPEAMQSWLEDPEFPETLKTEFRAFLDAPKRGRPAEKLGKIRPRRPEARREIRFNPKDAGVPVEAPERV